MSGINRRLFDKGLSDIYGIGGGISSFVISTQEVSTDANFAATTRNIAISSINTSATLLMPQSREAGGGGSDDEKCNFELTSSTNLRLTKNSATSGSTLYRISIIEFNPLILKSNQFVSSGYVSVDFDDITITAVDLNKSFAVSHLYDSDDTGNNRRFGWTAELTSTTNVRLATDFAGTGTVKGQVIEFI